MSCMSLQIFADFYWIFTENEAMSTSIHCNVYKPEFFDIAHLSESFDVPAGCIINRVYKDLKVLDLQANACLAHLVRHWTPKAVIICSIRSSPTRCNIFLLLLNPSHTRLPFLPTLYKL